jgi:hypothetical protein
MKAPLTAKSADNSREERIEEIEEQSLALRSLRYFFALFAVKKLLPLPWPWPHQQRDFCTWNELTPFG